MSRCAQAVGDAGPGETFHAVVAKDAAEAVLAEARRAKNAPMSIVFDKDSVTVTVGTGEPLSIPNRVSFLDATLPKAIRLILDMLAAAHARKGLIPGVLCIDPALMARFARVRPDRATRRADLLFGDGPREPILIKIGPTFRGLLMPIDREVNAANVGADGLW